MKFYLDEILDDSNENNNPAKREVDRMIDLLQELRVEFNKSMETVFKPVYKTGEDPIDVLLLPDLKLSEKVIMTVLRNRKNATIDQLMVYADIKKGACNRALRTLVELGYVVKLKMGTYGIAETKIY